MLSIYPFIESYPRERDNALTPGVDSPNSEADPCAVSEHLNIQYVLAWHISLDGVRERTHPYGG